MAACCSPNRPSAEQVAAHAVSTEILRSVLGSASKQPWQAFISVRSDLEEHMQRMVVESMVVPTAVSLAVVVWQDLSAAVYESQAAHCADIRAGRRGESRTRVERRRNIMKR